MVQEQAPAAKRGRKSKPRVERVKITRPKRGVAHEPEQEQVRKISRVEDAGTSPLLRDSCIQDASSHFEQPQQVQEPEKYKATFSSPAPRSERLKPVHQLMAPPPDAFRELLKPDAETALDLSAPSAKEAETEEYEPEPPIRVDTYGIPNITCAQDRPLRVSEISLDFLKSPPESDNQESLKETPENCIPSAPASSDGDKTRSNSTLNTPPFSRSGADTFESDSTVSRSPYVEVAEVSTNTPINNHVAESVENNSFQDKQQEQTLIVEEQKVVMKEERQEQKNLNDEGEKEKEQDQQQDQEQKPVKEEEEEEKESVHSLPITDSSGASFAAREEQQPLIEYSDHEEEASNTHEESSKSPKEQENATNSQPAVRQISPTAERSRQDYAPYRQRRYSNPRHHHHWNNAPRPPGGFWRNAPYRWYNDSFDPQGGGSNPYWMHQNRRGNHRRRNW
ncbi:hypothetical protein Ciccas_003899 [Cichlidogyrus casuarinus]|uniref:Uncharacterized protein n=1 Tax=Cichlidogyrus casuarinus TaxID=1844966 RepID=A0ABD2QD26_9PLAT